MSELPKLDEECFFIAPIGAEGSPERKRSDGVLKYIVARAAMELGLTAVRGDQIAAPGQITVQVLDHILNARAAVADLTDLNPNAFYELAVRHTARLPVALIAEKGCKLPFDIAQMRTIFVDSKDLESAEECRMAIVAQLKQALQDGLVDSPITTSIDVRALASGSAVERNIADMVTTVEEIVKSQRTIMDAVRSIQRYHSLVPPDIPLAPPRPPHLPAPPGPVAPSPAAYADLPAPPGAPSPAAYADLSAPPGAAGPPPVAYDELAAYAEQRHVDPRRPASDRRRPS